MYAILTKHNTLTCIRTTHPSFLTAVKLDFEEWKCINAMPESVKLETYLLDNAPVHLSIKAIANIPGALEALIRDVEER